MGRGRRKIVFVAILGILFGISSLGFYFKSGVGDSISVDFSANILKASEILAKNFDIEQYVVKEGDTWSVISENIGIGGTVAVSIFDSSFDVYDLASVRAGNYFRFFFDKIDGKMKVPCTKPKGMTLIEITLVIAILLGLIAILFLGIAAYKRGADRSKCILQLSTLEKIAISHGNTYAVDPGAALPNGILVTEGYLPVAYTCPDSGTYTYTDVMPIDDSGDTAYCTCNNTGPTHLYIPYP